MGSLDTVGVCRLFDAWGRRRPVRDALRIMMGRGAARRVSKSPALLRGGQARTSRGCRRSTAKPGPTPSSAPEMHAPGRRSPRVPTLRHAQVVVATAPRLGRASAEQGCRRQAFTGGGARQSRQRRPDHGAPRRRFPRHLGQARSLTAASFQAVRGRPPVAIQRTSPRWASTISCPRTTTAQVRGDRVRRSSACGEILRTRESVTRVCDGWGSR